MRVAFRADASVQIGTGHVVRCLTLAKALRDRGTNCIFFCRVLNGNVIERIRQEGFECNVLTEPIKKGQMQDDSGPILAHAEWLGTSWQKDAQEVIKNLGDQSIDWLVVDHYALDARWHSTLRPHVGQILVIDDLADRPLDCDIVLDQNVGRENDRYDRLIPPKTLRLMGTKYLLLRPEFAALRDESRTRMRPFPPRSFLVGMGGVDENNNVSDILHALASSTLPEDSRVTVVIGAQAPHLKMLRSMIPKLPFVTDLRVDASDMAQLLRDSDLAITASGLIIYELACMGVPTLLLPVSDIQTEMGKLISQSVRADVVDDWQRAPVPKILAGLQSLVTPSLMSRHIYKAIDGLGCLRVVEALQEKSYV